MSNIEDRLDMLDIKDLLEPAEMAQMNTHLFIMLLGIISSLLYEHNYRTPEKGAFSTAKVNDLYVIMCNSDSGRQLMYEIKGKPEYDGFYFQGGPISLIFLRQEVDLSKSGVVKKIGELKNPEILAAGELIGVCQPHIYEPLHKKLREKGVSAEEELSW